MIKNDKELYNAYGWLAANFDKWAYLKNSTALGLLSCYENISGPYDPAKAAPFEQWAINNRIEIIDMYNTVKD